MGCLNFDSEKKSNSLHADVSRVGFFDAVIGVVGDALNFVLDKVNRATDMSFERHGGFNAEFGLVCTRGEAKYLDVKPTRLYFFTGKLEDYVAVLSNTIWRAVK